MVGWHKLPKKLIHMDRQCPCGGGKMAEENYENGLMTKKEQFLAFVLVGATAQDISLESNDAQLIMHVANQIPEEKIPENAMNAAKVFLAFCNGVCEKPHNWMLAQ
jgi:hypothetical protein